MTRAELQARDLVRLKGVHPECAHRVLSVMAAMEAIGYPMTITDAVRTTAEQVALYAQGRTTPGLIVTNCDGIHTLSNHQPKADGLGRAIDCAFLDERLQPNWSAAYPWAAYGACGRALGLVWGGAFTSPVDRPHLEWPR
jgi:peptidoglycan L-alanyl-D-glutamate endopeptidase CwlK